MAIVIDPQFSVYALLARIRRTSTLINHRRTMTQMSYEIENAALLEGARGRIFAGFQRLSRFLPQAERYRKLAALSEHVYVFGLPDVSPPAVNNITYIPLERTHALVKEWFVVAYGSEFYSALATRELTNIDDPDEYRQFEGIWTFDWDMVDIIQEWLTSAVDAKPLLIERAEPPTEQTRIFNVSLSRLNDYVGANSRSTAMQVAQIELEQMMKKLSDSTDSASSQQ